MFGGFHMNRFHNVDGDKIPFTAAEELLRDDEETAEASMLPVRQMSNLRLERNRRLVACDDRFISDAPIGRGGPEWRTYRQELRDLPANTSDPANPVWPTEPE